MHSRADSTVAKYMYAYQRWKKWVLPRKDVKVMPADEVHFALYLQHLGETVKSKSAVEEAANAINWVHQTAGFPPVTESPFVCATISGLQRKLAKPKVKKEPVTSDMLLAVVENLGQNPSLSEVRLATAMLLGYAAFLRYDEMAKLKCTDIAINAEGMTVCIRSSKTDQYRQGDTVLIARTGSATCPVAMMERYLEMASISPTSSLCLFRGITKTKQGERLRASGSLSYTRMRELFLAKLTQLGFDSTKYGLHSLRSGGATAAANEGVPDRLFKLHGRWKSESAKDGYVKDSKEALMSVTKSLEL